MSESDIEEIRRKARLELARRGLYMYDGLTLKTTDVVMKMLIKENENKNKQKKQESTQ